MMTPMAETASIAVFETAGIIFPYEPALDVTQNVAARKAGFASFRLESVKITLERGGSHASKRRLA